MRLTTLFGSTRVSMFAGSLHPRFEVVCYTALLHIDDIERGTPVSSFSEGLSIGIVGRFVVRKLPFGRTMFCQSIDCWTSIRQN